jgi:hypothetical protein
LDGIWAGPEAAETTEDKESAMTLDTNDGALPSDLPYDTLDQIKLLVDERRQLLRAQDRGQWRTDRHRIQEIDQELSQLWQQRRLELQ